MAWKHRSQRRFHGRSARPQLVRGCGGIAALEMVAVSVAVSLLVAGMTPALRGEAGKTVARQLTGTLSELVDNPLRRKRHVVAAGSFSRGVGTLGRSEARTYRVTWRATANPEIAWLHGSKTAASSGSLGSARYRNSARGYWCVACANFGTEFGFGLGATLARHSTGFEDKVGMNGSAEVGVRAAVLAIGARNRFELSDRKGYAALKLDSRADGLVGASADGRATAAVSMRHQQVELGAQAVIGARGRVAQAASLELLGVAVGGNAAAEGWAGIGGTAGIAFHRKGGRIETKARLGGALGLGGALEVETSLDVSGLHRYLIEGTRFLEFLDLPTPHTHRSTT